MRSKRLLSVAGLCALGFALLTLLARYFPKFAADWALSFYPATMLWLHGENPYQVSSLHNPVWALLPLVPLALLGPKAGAVLLFSINYAGYVLLALRFKARSVALLAFLLSPMIVLTLAVGNIDGILCLGLLLPPPIGLFFAVSKPQIGAAVAAYWAYAAWKEGGVPKLAATFLPVTAALAGTFLLWGNWTANRSDDIMAAPWNASFFPWSVPLGIALLYIALRRRKMMVSISASPFFSPYVSINTWGVGLAGLLEHDRIILGVSIGLWIAVVIVAMQFFHWF
jgi:hypothetical protein